MKTTRENVRARLYLRFAVMLLLSLLIGAGVFGNGLAFPRDTVGLCAFLPIPLSLLAPLLSVPNTYLCTLSILCGGYHGILLARCILLVRTGATGILLFNAALLLIFFSLALFLLVSAKACQFAFENPARDTALLFKRGFLKYLAEALLFTALSVSVYFLWSKLLEALPL